MMKIQELINFLDSQLHPCYQETWDNSGFLVGHTDIEARGALVCLDVTPAVIAEAREKGMNLIVSHHPLIYKGMQRITPTTELGRMVLELIEQGIAVYAAHTNLDNLLWGVSGTLATRLGLEQVQVLQPKPGLLRKLVTYCPTAHAEAVRQALFAAGAGTLGNYDNCSYCSTGTGSFRPNDASHPFVGTPGQEHHEEETRIEVLYPTAQEGNILAALRQAHPYEEPAIDLISLANSHPGIGGGAWGLLPQPMEVHHFLSHVKEALHLPVVRCSALCHSQVQRVALCGGSGAFLIPEAKSVNADIYLTGDLKYHDFQQAEDRIILADVGHYESEQFAKDIIYHIISEKFPTFACEISARGHSLVHYI